MFTLEVNVQSVIFWLCANRSKVLIVADHRDTDWALAKEGKRKGGQPAHAPEPRVGYLHTRTT